MVCDPQMIARGMVETVGTVDGEDVRQIGIGPKLSDTPGAVRSLGPMVGEHTDEILHGLGYNSEAIQALRQMGAVG